MNFHMYCMYACMSTHTYTPAHTHCRHTGELQAAMKGLGVAYSDVDINKITQRHVREREVPQCPHVCSSGLAECCTRNCVLLWSGASVH